MELRKSISKSRAFVASSISSGASSVSEGFTTVRTFIVGAEHRALTTAEVLENEFEEIWVAKGSATKQKRNRPPDEKTERQREAAYRNKVHEKEQAALCLSGGGIRSAAFSLGVLQVLAARGLLTKFHYLSTVSGGGYIGAWLSRWISEHENQDADAVAAELAKNPGGSETKQISNLRANSNFLTPKIGITSADTWTGVILWIRNMLLNWSVFIPALLMAVMAPNIYLVALAAAKNAPTEPFLFGYPLAIDLLGLGFLCLAFATWQGGRHLPSHGRSQKFDGHKINRLIVVYVLTWAALVPVVLLAGGYPYGQQQFQIWGYSYGILFWLLAASYAAKIIGYLLAWFTDWRNFRLFTLNSVTWAIISAIATGALWLAISIIGWIAHALPDTADLLISKRWPTLAEDAPLIFTLCILGPLGVTLAHLLLSALYAGFRVADFQDDADREWLARVSAVSVFPTLLWAVFAGACLFLPWLIIDNLFLKTLPGMLDPVAKALTAITGAISGLIAVFGGQSPSTKLDLVASAPEKKKSRWVELLVKVATLVFIAALFMCLARVERLSAEALTDVLWKDGTAAALMTWFPRVFVFLLLFLAAFGIWYVASAKTMTLVAVTAILAVLTLGFGFLSDDLARWLWLSHALVTKIAIAHLFIGLSLIFLITVTSEKIDVNRYSLHGVYRNRLVRAFLGGARARRSPNVFTEFDAEDDKFMYQLGAQSDGKRVLFPVINTTLNLVGGENLAWQERKASSFIITPLAWGSGTLCPYDFSAPPDKPPGAYVHPNHYGDSEPDLRLPPAKAKKKGASPVPQKAGTAGITLGTAMTISGAAVSPSQGYNSSPTTAFLLTLFNVRLGAWLANPAAGVKLEIKRSGPTNSLRPLLVEALGKTNEKSNNVYLSDGGHFDNLGLYEMIRRRCRFILVVDAEADKGFAFEDFGKAVRQVVIDLDADIAFKSIKMKSARVAKEDSPTFAVGEIVYGEKPDNPGLLIYLKPTYFYETVPVDVRAYGTVNGDFPHETTLDQWFSESQFESYRRLGYYLTDKLCEKQGGRFTSMKQFFSVVQKSAAKLKADPLPASTVVLPASS